MDKKKKNIILLSILIIILLLIIMFIRLDFFSTGSLSNTLLIGNKKEFDIEKKDKNKIILDESNEDVILDTTTSSDINNEIVNDNEDVTIVSKEENNINYSETGVVDYFKNIGNEVEESTMFKEKFKEYFITCVDFIFYDKEINSYTFNELNDSAKAKVISIALKIDSKIEEYIPNYKENISSTSTKIYTSVKGKLVALYMDIAIDICSENEQECDKVKEIFSDIKRGCDIGWDFIKRLVGDGFTKVKEWYEIYSGK